MGLFDRLLKGRKERLALSSQGEPGFFARLLASNPSADITELEYDQFVTPEKLRRKYNSNGVVRALTDARPDATWAGDHYVTVNGRRSRELNLLCDRFDLWQALHRADVASEITGFAGILIPGNDLRKPPDPFELDVAKLSVYGLDQLRPKAVGGYIDSYDLMYTDPNEEYGNASITDIHPARVLPVADTRYSESGIVGQSRIRNAWNLITDYERVVGGASLGYLRNSFGLKTVNFKTDTSVPTQMQREALEKQIRDLDATSQKVLTLTDADMKVHAPTVARFQAEANQLLILLSASWRVPLTEVTGESLVAHSANTAQSGWLARIDERRAAYIAKIVARGALWLRNISVEGRWWVQPDELMGVGVEWAPHEEFLTPHSVTADIIQAVQANIISREYAMTLLPASEFGPVDQRQIGEEPHAPPPMQPAGSDEPEEEEDA